MSRGSVGLRLAMDPVDEDPPPGGCAAATDLSSLDEAVGHEVALGALDGAGGHLAERRKLGHTAAPAKLSVRAGNVGKGAEHDAAGANGDAWRCG